MANAFTQFLSNFAGGVFADQGYLKDYKHAARLYADENYGLAPKAGWSYFVEFAFNPRIKERLVFPAIDQTWFNRYSGKVGLLCKTVDQPRISISTETLNQYNRKSIVQTKINYNPISITFHDDMNNVTTNLWKNYYQYYYADSRYNGISVGNTKGQHRAIPQAFRDTKYETRAYAYGLNNGQTEPFFSYITIYLLNRKKFNTVTLINPLIIEWNPANLDQTNGQRLLDSRMTLSYEAVYYDLSNIPISKENPGFQKEHYDNSPSPLSISGRGTKSILGPGGLLAGASDIFGTLTQEGPLSGADLLRVAIQGKNLVQNAKSITKEGLKQEGYSVLNGVFAAAATGSGSFVDNAATAASAKLAPAGIEIFKNIDQSKNTTAQPRNIGGGT